MQWQVTEDGPESRMISEMSVVDSFPGNIAAAFVKNGGALDDQLTGSASADILRGFAGDDTLTGGLDADILIGGVGADTYVWKKGDGADRIIDQGFSRSQTDRLSLTDVASSDVTLTRNGADLLVKVNSTGETILVAGQFEWAAFGSYGYSDGIEAIRFSDGVNWSLNDILAHTATNGAAADDRLVGTALADNLFGLAGADRISAGAGDDTLNGGLGADILRGGAGSDTYVWKKGDGADAIIDRGGARSQTDTLSLTDVASSDVTLTRSGAKLLVKINSTGEMITIVGQFDRGDFGASGFGIEALRFSDGVTWSLNDILAHTATNGSAGDDRLVGTTLADNIHGLAGADRINGWAGNDMLYGGLGADILRGGAGANTFVFDSLLGPTNIDRIVDFDVAHDNIALAQAIFSAAGAVGTLASGVFRIGTAATAAQDRIIYNSTTGALYYDSDGNRYYTSQALLQGRKADAGSIARVAAPEVEALIAEALRANMERIVGQSAGQIEICDARDGRLLLDQLLQSATIHRDRIEMVTPPHENDAVEASHIPSLSIPFKPSLRPLKGVAYAPQPRCAPMDEAARISLLTAIARSRGWIEAILREPSIDFAAIAARENLAERHVRFLATLAYLSPRIVEAIAAGCAPAGMAVRRLARHLPFGWAEQEKLVDF